jgi:galactose mutarotase-like enzyme
MQRIDYLGVKVARWDVGPSTFLAWPEMGARLMHWGVQLPDGTPREVIRWPELSSIDEFVGARGGNPILFPFPARTFDRGDIHFWRDPEGQRRPMPMHGIARNSKFALVDADQHGFTAQLIPDEAGQQAYPYRCEFTVSYRFRPLGLSVELRLNNLEKRPIPWCGGHHFYFGLPWREGSEAGDYRIRIPAAKAWRQDSEGKLVAQLDFSAESSFDDPELRDRIHTGLQSDTVKFGEPGGDQVAIRMGAAPKPPEGWAVVTWNQKPEDRYYCVEPWMGVPNTPENQIGLHWVEPGKFSSFDVSVDLEP